MPGRLTGMSVVTLRTARRLSGSLNPPTSTRDESQNEVKIGSMWPNFMGQIGAVYLTMYTKHFPQDVEYTHGPYTLSPGKNQKSFRCTGRVTRLKFSGNSSPSYARMGKCEFDVDIVGGR